MAEEMDALTISNQLMKLRETLLDDESKGVIITSPSGISIFPYNNIMGFFLLLSVISLVSSIFIWILYGDK